MKRRLSLLTTILIFFETALGHPVAFEDSVGIMGKHSPILSHSQLNYSVKHWFAIGLHYFRRPDQRDHDAIFATTNFLLKRWNGEGLQANVYTIAGGGSSALNGKAGGQYLGGLQFDIENRRYYFLAKHQSAFDLNREDLNQSNLRVGLAPYVASFDELHSWIILDWTSTKFQDGSGLDDLTPTLRFFYRNVLFEIGQSFNGLTKLNYIIHY